MLNKYSIFVKYDGDIKLKLLEIQENCEGFEEKKDLTINNLPKVKLYVKCESDFFCENVTFVDCPGFGTRDSYDEILKQYLKEANLFIYVVDPKSGWSDEVK